MSSRRCQAAIGVIAALLTTLTLLRVAAAQEQPKSAPLAKELAQLLEQHKLDSIAAKDPAQPDHFVGALYVPGLQFLVVSARYAAPPLMNERIGKKEYREVYIDLNSASIPESKVFVEDLRADGLFREREGDQASDAVEKGGKRTMFDGDWKKQKLSEKEYMDLYATADDQYAKYLSMLIAEAKKGS
jgi:hypothetical protein